MTESWDTPPGQLTPEEMLDGFSQWQEIGRGGDATVYRAVQDALGREVAIKVLMVDDEESVRRFTREVQLMVSLGRQHPNIAKVLQIGTSSWGRPCIVMDYYELGSLDKRLAAAGPLSGDEAIHVGTVVADALSFAHGKGVLHRDVKPQNVLILPTSYVLADFGIARLIDSAHSADTDRFSYRHASPQVLDGLAPSESDDIFSLGATLFHLLDGRPPFTRADEGADSALDYINRVRNNERRQLTRPDLPPSLVAVIDQSLHPDPAERMSSAEDLRDLLAMVRAETRRWGRGQQTSPPAPGAPPLPRPPATAASGSSAAGVTSAPTGGSGPLGDPGGAGVNPDQGDSTVLRPAGAAAGIGGDSGVSGAHVFGTRAVDAEVATSMQLPGPAGVPGAEGFTAPGMGPARLQTSWPSHGSQLQAPPGFTGPHPGLTGPPPGVTGPPPGVGAGGVPLGPDTGYTAPPPLGHGFTAPPPPGMWRPAGGPTPTGSTAVLGEPRRFPRLWLMVAAGLAVLLLIGVIWYQTSDRVEPAAPTNNAPVLADNPNLRPRTLQITITGDQATATWSKALDSPDYWRWKAAGTPDQLKDLPEQAGQTRRSATVTMDPAWKQVCFQVSGVTTSERGDKQLCQAR